MKSEKKHAAQRTGMAVDQARRPPAASPASGPSRLTGRRQWSFRLAAAVGIPALLFGLLELTLRLLGYGYSPSFFVNSPVAGQNALVENRQFSRRYFPPELVRRPEPLAFSPVKPTRTLRIFVFWESAAEGDPAPAFGFARILQVMLRERYPDREIEVINTAVTAINSHVIRPIARECAGYSGDVWVIYMGNNEVVGPFGSGTVFGAQTTTLPVIRTSLALKTTRTGQLLDGALDAITYRGPRMWRGMGMFLQQQVRQSDPRMAVVYSHFQENLSDIVAFGVRSGAKVVVATIGANLRDCAPFASLHRADLSAAQTAEWESLYGAGVALENEGKYAEAIAQYQRAGALDDQFADLQFRWARCHAALGQREHARQRFALARDFDTLRFRADSRINEAIRHVAGEWQSRGVRLADVEAALAQESADGVPGEEWFYEHVHPTFAGNYQVAWQLAEQVESLLPNAAAPQAGDPQTPFLSLEECSQRLGLTDCKRLRMADETKQRTSRPPFTQQLDHAVRMARAEQMLSTLRQQDRTNFPVSAAIYREALAHTPDDWQLHDNFASALLHHGDVTNAIAHWRRVAQLLPHRVRTYDLMGMVLRDQYKLDDAEACYLQALRIQPNFAEGRIGLGLVRLGQQRETEALAQFRRAVKLQPRSPRILNDVGVALLKMGRSAEAEDTFRAALGLEPEFELARLNLGKALLAQGKGGAAIATYQELLHRDPSNAPLRLALGKAFAILGKMDEAIQQYSEVVRQQPDNFDARCALGDELVRINRLAEAADHYAAAIRLRPDAFEPRINYGSILGKEGRTAGARTQFEEALRLKPDFTPAHFNLAITLIGQNQLPEAIVHLREVLRLEPQNVGARNLLETALARQKGGR